MKHTPEPKRPEHVSTVVHGILRLGVETKDLGTLISGIRDILGSVMDTTNFYLGLYDPDTKTYRFPFFADQHEDADPDVSEALPKSLTDYVRRTGKPALVDKDLYAKLVDRGEAEIVGPGSQQWMGAPLLLNEKGVIGVVSLQSYDDPVLYSAEDLGLLNAVAGTISIAVERKRAEEALRTSQENLSLVFDTITDVLFHLQVEGENRYRVASVNKAFFEVTGLKEDQVVGKMVEEVIPEPTHELVFGKYAQAIRERSTVRWKEISTYPTGTLTGIISVTPVFDDSGTCTHLVGSVHDVTDLRRAEEIVNQSPAVVFVWKNAKGWPIEYVSDNVVSLLEYSAEELMSKQLRFSEVVHPDDLERVGEEVVGFDGEPAGARLSHAPYRVVTRSGQHRWVDDRTVVQRNNKGEITHYQGIVIDITDRMQAIDALRESEARWRSITESTSDHILLLDLEKRILFINHTVSDLTREDVIGRPIGDFTPPEMHQASKDCYDRVAKTIAPSQYETVFINRDGERRYFNVRVGPVIEDGELVGFVSSATDVTNRREAEAELAEHREHLEEEVMRRTADLRKAVDLMAGREVRMAELKEEVRELQERLARSDERNRSQKSGD